jgi:hypothetical protein
MQRQQALLNTQWEVSDNILQLTMYQADLRRGKVTLGTGEIVDVYQTLQLGWRPTMLGDKNEQGRPEYQEVDLTQEWSEPEPVIKRRTF